MTKRQTILFITVYTGVGLNTDIHKGLYDRFRSLPMWQPAPVQSVEGLSLGVDLHDARSLSAPRFILFSRPACVSAYTSTGRCSS